jgi:YHS domain-containing protein
MRQLIFLALIVALAYVISRLVFPRRHVPRQAGRRPSTATTEEMVRDPVCQVYIPRSGAIRREIRGQEQFFCSPGCLDKFLAIRS